MRITGWLLLSSILLNGSNVFSGVMIDGELERLNEKDWLPKKVYLTFNYDSQGNISGYRVAFQADKGQLFNEWKLKNDDGDSMRFPFVLESTLVIENEGEVDSIGTWGFGRLDGDNSNIPDSYKDSEFLDLSEDNYGIGIINPYKLQGDVVYDYWMGLKSAGWTARDPKKLKAFLRFRLNLDLSAAKKFGYSKDEIKRDLKLGDLWEGFSYTKYGYDAVDVSKSYSANDIGEYFSFAIECVNSSNYLTYSDYIVLDGTHGSEKGLNGQWCKTRGEADVKKVSSLEECFGIKNTPSDPPNGAFTCKDVQDGFKLKVGTSIYPNQCVWYVRHETGLEYNCCNTSAKLCYDQAKACGYEVGQTPQLGSVMVLNGWKANPDGHVGIVIGIDEKNHKIKLRHANWDTNPKVSYVSENWVSTNAFPVKGYIYAQGESCGGPGTSTQPDPSDPPASGKLPDFITSKVAMGNQSGSKEKYTWKINETAYVHSWTDNIGDANWQGSADRIKVPFYLSKGTKEDSHSEWKRIGREEIKKDKLKVNQPPKHEYIKFKLQDYADNGTVMPGRTYNFVVCADRPKDQDNGDGDVKEKHKSNNCSTEAVFYVDYGPPRNVDLIARNLALTGGRSQLQAGEKYGLQVEISNIGTQQPWNGFSSSYEIKGPGTGGVWQRIGEDTSRASSLYPNAIHFESMSSEQEVAAPMVGGDYVFRACADYTQAVPETNESNNCTDELPVNIAPPPMPDLITEGLQLTHGRTSLIAGELYGLTVAIRNIGDATPSSNIRSSYEIKGPGTGDAWQLVADDGSDADQLYPGASQWEEITDEHGAHIPNVPGTYTARACADYQGNAAESDESNNCSEMTFEVNPVPAGSPRIVITNPTHTDEWRSSSTAHDIRWERYDFPSPGHVRIEYSLDGGATWLLIDDNTTNDEVKHWDDMCDYHTVDTDDAMIRITSLEYPYVYDVSDEFSIDHAAECK